MITPIFLNKVAEAVDNTIKSTATVTVGGTDINVPLTRSTVVDNVASTYFTLDNTISGLVTRITLKDNNNNPLVIEDLEIQKQLGSIYVGTFRIIVEEDI